MNVLAGIGFGFLAVFGLIWFLYIFQRFKYKLSWNEKISSFGRLCLLIICLNGIFQCILIIKSCYISNAGSQLNKFKLLWTIQAFSNEIMFGFILIVSGFLILKYANNIDTFRSNMDNGYTKVNNEYESIPVLSSSEVDKTDYETDLNADVFVSNNNNNNNFVYEKIDKIKTINVYTFNFLLYMVNTIYGIIIIIFNAVYFIQCNSKVMFSYYNSTNIYVYYIDFFEIPYTLFMDHIIVHGLLLISSVYFWKLNNDWLYCHTIIMYLILYWLVRLLITNYIMNGISYILFGPVFYYGIIISSYYSDCLKDEYPTTQYIILKNNKNKDIIIAYDIYRAKNYKKYYLTVPHFLRFGKPKRVYNPSSFPLILLGDMGCVKEDYKNLGLLLSKTERDIIIIDYQGMGKSSPLFSDMNNLRQSIGNDFYEYSSVDDNDLSSVSHAPLLNGNGIPLSKINNNNNSNNNDDNRKSIYHGRKTIVDKIKRFENIDYNDLSNVYAINVLNIIDKILSKYNNNNKGKVFLCGLNMGANIAMKIGLLHGKHIYDPELSINNSKSDSNGIIIGNGNNNNTNNNSSIAGIVLCNPTNKSLDINHTDDDLEATKLFLDRNNGIYYNKTNIFSKILQEYGYNRPNDTIKRQWNDCGFINFKLSKNEIKNIHIQTLILYGDNDTIFDESLFTSISKKIGKYNTALEAINNSGNKFWFDNTHQFVSTLKDFMEFEQEQIHAHNM